MSKSVKTAAEKNEEYLQRLEHKNRLKKNLSIKKVNEKKVEDREKGFSTHFAGANASEDKNVRLRPTALLNTPNKSNANSFKLVKKEVPIYEQHGRKDGRKGWAHSPQRGTRATLHQSVKDREQPLPSEERRQQCEEEEDYSDEDFEEDEASIDGLDEESTTEIDGFHEYTHVEGVQRVSSEEVFHDSIEDVAGMSRRRSIHTSPSHTLDDHCASPALKYSCEGEHTGVTDGATGVGNPLLGCEHSEDNMAGLASRLQALDPIKQGELLAMLQVMERGGEIAVDDSAQKLHVKNTINDKPIISDTLRPRVGKSVFEKESQRISLHCELPEQTHPERPQKDLTQRPEDMAKEIITPGSRKAANVNSTKIKIRIKSYSCWGKTKYASLSAVRLCVKGSNVEIPLSEFSILVMTGNDVQPKTAEVSRKVPNLFHKSRVMQKHDWIFPIMRNSCVQLELSGTVDGTSVDNLELIVWNGRDDNNNTSPVMDMDIYFESKCVWTGTVDRSTATGEICASSNVDNSRLLFDHCGSVRGPSVTASLVPSRIEAKDHLNNSKAVTISTQIVTKAAHKRSAKIVDSHGGSDGSNVPSLTFTGMSTASSVGDFMTKTNLTAASAAPHAEDLGDTPSWFSDLKTPRSDIEIISARDKYFNSNNDSDTLPLRRASKASSSSRLQTTPGRHRRHLTESDSDSLRNIDHSSPAPEMEPTTKVVPRPKEGVAPRAGRRAGRRHLNKAEERQEDASLRQSLDALNQSDLRNRGRIESELQASAKIVEEKVNTFTDDTHDFSDAAPVGLLSELSHLSVFDNVLSNEVEKQNILKQRSQKIDEVQETVSSALQDLASVMSNLSMSGRVNLDHSPISAVQQQFSEPRVLAEKHVEKTDQKSQTMDDNFSPLAIEHDQRHLLVSASFDDYLESSSHEIPLLPRGKLFEFEVLSTWGDPYYVGLNGIDLFDSHGDILSLSSGIVSVSAVPGDINDLPEYHLDPRTASNLLDETNFTCDDMHVWLAPHGQTMTPPLPVVATVKIVFATATSLSLVRIWNYNKSRTHCHRGVRRARMKLDKVVIFEGEIRIAPGMTTSSDDCSEVVLFTTTSSVLEKISSYDAEMGYRENSDEADLSWLAALQERHTNFRPSTSDGLDSTAQGGCTTSLKRKKAHTSIITSQLPHVETSLQSKGDRPFTAVREDAAGGAERNSSVAPFPSAIAGVARPISPLDQEPKETHLTAGVISNTEAGMCLPECNISQFEETPSCDVVRCRVLTLVLESTWGDKSYIGLSGLEVLLGCSSIVADLGPNSIDASPRDLSTIGVFDDPRVPENLIKGNNNTTDDQHMWLIPYTAGGHHELRVDMGHTCELSGLNIWNYNKSTEDVLRGVRVVSILGDGLVIGKQELRIAPGCDGVVFKQSIKFGDVKKNSRHQTSGILQYITPTLRQDYESPFNLSGMLWKINIYSNWGDSYYAGLDGLEFLDVHGQEIDIFKRAIIVSSPHMWDLEAGANDPRVPENLGSRAGAWLTPLSQCITRAEQQASVKRLQESEHQPLPLTCPSSVPHDAYFFDHNVLFVLFDQPVHVAVIRFFNYSKSPNRGVKQFGIEVDHKVVYMGRLQRHDTSLTTLHHDSGQSVVFTNDPSITRREKDKVSYCGATDQDVLCINDRKVAVRSKDMYETPSVAAEGIHSDLAKRPTTAAWSSK